MSLTFYTFTFDVYKIGGRGRGNGFGGYKVGNRTFTKSSGYILTLILNMACDKALKITQSVAWVAVPAR